MQRRSRQIVERCFSLLKLKFRRLKVIDVHNMEYLSDIIIACCCLHNFVLDEPFFEPANMNEFLIHHPDDDIEDDDDFGNNLDYLAEIRRDELAGFFMPR